MATLQPKDHVVLNQRTVTLTDAQIKALPTTKVALIPAPGSNRVLVPDVASLVLSFNNVADYSNVDNAAKVTLSVTANTWIGWDVIYTTGGLKSFFQWGEPVLKQVAADQIRGNQDTQYNLANLANAPLLFAISNGVLTNFTGGHADNTLTVTVLYTVYDVSAKRFV